MIFAIPDTFGIDLEHFEVEAMLSYPQIVEVLVRNLTGPAEDYWKRP